MSLSFGICMTPEEFKKAWEQDGDNLCIFPSEAVEGLDISESQRIFLTNIGLPESAAPFLDFGGKHYLPIPSVADVWKGGTTFECYRAIGCNGFGDPVCIDENSGGAVVYLNHDDNMKRQFINSSVECLAFSLLAFRTVVRDAQARGGPDAHLNGQIPNDVADQFIRRMDEVDPDAIKPETFWFRSVMNEGI
jgi:hypothetical protein